VYGLMGGDEEMLVELDFNIENFGLYFKSPIIPIYRDKIT
jgi:hypothetical protein|tara:strand:- start:1260 stop:1379 length:120 start_codon:yes stop_codon:yes gene_type:complete